MKVGKKVTSWITNASKKKSFPLAIRIGSLIFFIFIILALTLGSISIFSYSFDSNIAMYIIWVLWWPFLYITLFVFARAWCGFLCPLSLANEIGNKFGRKKVLNFRKWNFVPFVLFFVIVYIEQVSGLFLSKNVTLWFFIIFFLLAFIMGILFMRFSFCKLICPIGTILRVFSRLSIIGLRTKKEICKTCPEKFCLIGKKADPCPMFNNIPALSSNSNCLLCTNCIKNCPHGSTNIGIVKPGKEILDKAEFNLSESYFIIALLGLAFILSSNGTNLVRAMLPIQLAGAILRGADFVIAIGGFLILFWLMVKYVSKKIKIEYKKVAKETGYYYLPICFAIMFFTISFGFLGPILPISQKVIAGLKIVILLAGAFGSGYIIKKMAPEKMKKLFLMSVAVLVLVWIMFVITNPLNILEVQKEVAIVYPGETLEIEAYSMGFNPDQIVLQKGEEVTLKINDLDIMHSFDIDKLDFHVILLPKDEVAVTFTPDRIGEFTFKCNIPGHTETGMYGTIKVVENLEEE